MPDYSKIIGKIPKDYKKQKKINGTFMDTYCFYSWTVYNHPIHLINPAKYEETQIAKQGEGPYAYYEASFHTAGTEPILIFVEKSIVKRKHIHLDSNQLRESKPGDVYYLCQINGDSVLLEKEVKLDETFGAMQFLHITSNDIGSRIKAELVWKEFNYSYEYEYDAEGLKKITVIDSIEGRKVAERGQEQIF